LLKSKFEQNKQQKAHKDRTIRELESRLKNPGMPGQLTKDKTHLVSALKEKLKETRRDNLKLKRDLRNLKKNLKLTYMSELESEKNAYYEEFERLHQMISKIEENAEMLPQQDTEEMKNKLQINDSELKQIMSEHDKLETELKNKQLELKKYKDSAESKEKEKEQQSQIDSKTVKMQEKEIEKLKKRIEDMKKEEQKGVGKGDIEKMKKNKDEISKKVKDQQNKIADLEAKMQVINQEKDREISDLKKQLKSSAKKQQKSPQKAILSDDLISELHENLAKSGLNSDKIKGELFEQFEENEKISVQELSKILMRQPCSLSNENAMKMALNWVLGEKTSMQITRKKLLSEITLQNIIDKFTNILSESKVLKKSPEKAKFDEDTENVKVEIEKDEKSEENREESIEKEIKDMTEDEMVEVTQKCFMEIANQMNSKKETMETLFGEIAYTKSIENEEAILLNPKDFLKQIESKLGITFKPIEKTCLSKVLAMSETEDAIKLNDLAQILHDFGIKAEGVESEDNEEMNFNELDKVSMVLMLALTEYIMSSKIPLYDLFADNIYQQDVQVEEEQLKVDMINSADFFETLTKIGISMEEKEHDNLKKFLCIDPEYMDKLMIKKLKRAIEEFAVNETIREMAQKCYQELVEEEGDQNEGEHGDLLVQDENEQNERKKTL